MITAKLLGMFSMEAESCCACNYFLMPLSQDHELTISLLLSHDNQPAITRKTKECFLLLLIMFIGDQNCHASTQKWHLDNCSNRVELKMFKLSTECKRIPYASFIYSTFIYISKNNFQ